MLHYTEMNPPQAVWSNAKVDDFTMFLLTYPESHIEGDNIDRIIIDYANQYGDEYDNPPGKNFVDGYGHGYNGIKYSATTTTTTDGDKKKRAKAKFHDRLRRVERGFKKGADWIGKNVLTSRNIFYLFVFIVVFLVGYFLVKSIVDATYGKAGATQVMQNMGGPGMFGYGATVSAMDTCGSTHCLSLLILEVILWSAFIIYSFLLYYKVSKSDAERFFENLVRYLLSDHFDYSGLLVSGGAILLFYILVAMSGVPVFSMGGDASRPFTIMFFETLLWTVFSIMLFSFGINHIFHVNLGDLLLGRSKKKDRRHSSDSGSDTVSPYEDDDPNSELSSTTVPAATATTTSHAPTIGDPKVSKTGKMTYIDGYYNFADANEICTRKNGHLATYQELKQIESSGELEWCKIGWSADQVGAFINKTKACGKKGINAAFISNPDERHGINCYTNNVGDGKKKEGFDTLIPRMSELDKSIEFATKNHSFGNGWLKI